MGNNRSKVPDLEKLVKGGRKKFVRYEEGAMLYSMGIHTFQQLAKDDEDMLQLIESIRDRGVITPATVRQKEDGRYELISGHRRKRACELAGFQTLRCEVVDMSRDEATILMVESNFQRSKILPSEKRGCERRYADNISAHRTTVTGVDISILIDIRMRQNRYIRTCMIW